MIATVIIFMSEFYFLITPVLCGCCEFWWWFITYFTAEGNSYDWWWKLFCDIIPHFYLISSFAIYDHIFFRSVKQRESDQPTSVPIITWRHYYTGSAINLFESFSFAGKDDTSKANHFKKPSKLGTSFFILTKVVSWWVYLSDFKDGK